MFDQLIKRANVVIEALPYLRRFHQKIVIIKYGGGAMTDRELKEKVTQDVVLLKFCGLYPVLVHGGGPEINRILKRRNIPVKFVEGLRYTDEATMDVVDQALGNVNSKLVSLINRGGGKARGLSGRKGKLIRARKLTFQRNKKKVDLGFVGEVKSVDVVQLKSLIAAGRIPVISSIGIDHQGQLYNINADQAAAEIASALGAAKLILLTDVFGVLGKDGKLINKIDASHARRLIRNNVIHGGMIPKVRWSLDALKNGVEQVHIINGKIPHAVLLEVFTDHGIGTMVQRSPSKTVLE